MRKTQRLVQVALEMFEELIVKYEKLKQRYDISDYLKIGAALASGVIEIQIQGDEKYHQEVNIVGESIVKCVRLEAYTKFLMNQVSPDSSMLILSPEVVEKLEIDLKYNIRTWNIYGNEQSVRDYPDLKKIYYMVWVPATSQSQRSSA